MNNTAEKIFETKISTQSSNLFDLSKALEIFRVNKEEKIILKSNFEDNYWKMSDEYSHVGLDFSINKFYYKNSVFFSMGINENELILYLKCFILFSLKEYSLNTFRSFLNDIEKIIEIQDENIDYSINIYNPCLVIDFFSFIPIENTELLDSLLESLDYYTDYFYEKNKSNMRKLATFDSYFLFNDIINDYWSQSISLKDRLFYYPLYLWWMITGIIPIRPREFILTPRNCIFIKEGEWWIKLRRNNIKGFNKSKSHKIDLDYRIEEYPITKEIADDINKYLDLTKDFESNELNTLFIADTHYHKWFYTKNIRSRYLTYANMNTILRYFYDEIIIGRYGLKLVNKEFEKLRLNEYEIQYIHLGDTRVISMINVMLEGGTPALAMWLSGHESLSEGFNYYGNISMLIECRTYKEYRKVLQGNITYYSLPIKYSEFKDKDYIILENGDRCYSQNTINKSFIDCLKVSGPEGEIGYCPSCSWFRKNGANFFASEDKYKTNINESYKFLANAVQSVRKVNGNLEDIKVGLMKLQNTSFEYEQFLKEKISRGF